MGNETTNTSPTTQGISEQLKILQSILGKQNDLSGQQASLGKTELGIQAGLGALQGFLSMKQYGLAKDQFKESKRQFNLNFNNQKKNYNTTLEDRQMARHRANPNAYQSPAEYMQKNRL